jgi:hypothetical protein
MLHFLRRIRRGLINTGATRKYLLYAIGEIILVVIGILIALQINNWNEDSKLAIQETIIIENLLGNLKQAKIQSDHYIEQENQLIKSLISALGINPDQTQNDEISWSNTEFYKLMWDFESVVPVINTYSDIKNTGELSIIKNKNIRESFTDLELKIEGLNSQVADRLTVQQLRVDEIGVNEINFIPLLQKHKTNISISDEITNDYKSILSSPKTRNLLAIKLDLTYTTLNNRENLAKAIDQLILMLETELEVKTK